MKLLHKLNSRYLQFSVLIFLLFVVALYAILSRVITEEVDEKLTSTQHLIQHQVESGSVQSIEPFIIVKETEASETSSEFSDTTLVNPVNNDKETFRQLCSICRINGDFYKIIVRESRLDSDDLLESIALIAAVMLFLLAGSLFTINFFINRSVLKPFYQDLERVKQFSLQDMVPVQLSDSEITEFDLINKSIETLTNKVVADYKNLKQFSENASHELQTPLSIIRTKLEKLINTNSLSTPQFKIIQDINTAVDRLARLNKNLILLAKVENKQFADVQELRPVDFIRDALELLQELIDLKNLNVKTSLNEQCTIKMSGTLLEILINNLLTNAVHHTKAGGAVDIQLNGNKLVIKNSGDKKLQNPDKIFERFYKDDPSSQSIGLGLSIVKKICETHGFQISYSFEKNMHIFQLLFSV